MAETSNKAERPDALDPGTLERIMDIIQSVNSGIINVRRYPPGSAVMEMALQRGLTALTELLPRLGSLTIGQSEGKLIIDQHALDDRVQKRAYVASFLEVLDQKNIQSLTFRPGLTQEELLQVLHILGGSAEELARLGHLGEHLASRGIRNVAVDEKVFVAVTKDQTVIEKVELERLLERGPVDPAKVRQGVFAEYLLRYLKVPGLDISPEKLRTMTRAEFAELAQRIAASLEAQGARGVTEKEGRLVDEEGDVIQEGEDPHVHQLMKTFERVSHALARLPNEAVRARILSDLTRVIVSFKTGILARIVASRMGAESTRLNLKGYVLAQTDTQRKSELIDQLLEKYERALEGLAPEDFALRFADLKESERVLKALLARQKQGPAPELPAETVQKLERALGLVARLAQEGGTPENLLLMKARRVIAQPAEFFRQPLVQSRLPELMTRVLAADRPDIAKSILDRLTANLRDPAPENRDAALSTLVRLSRSLKETRYPFMAQEAIAGIARAMAAEPEAARTESVQAALAAHAADLLRAGDFDAAAALLAALDAPRPAGAPRADFVRGILRRVSADPEMVKSLLAAIESPDETATERAARAVAMLDAAAIVPHLVELLEAAEDRRIRKRCLAVIEAAGESALPTLCKLLREKERTAPWYLIRNLVHLVAHAGGEQAIDDLLRCADHPDARVRRAAYQELGRSQDVRARRALAAGLDDEDISVRRMLVTFFGTHHDKTVAPALVRMLEAEARASGPEAEALAADLCRALGRIGDERAVEPLLRIVRPEGLLGLFRKKSDRLLEAAIHALGDLRARAAQPVLQKHAGGGTPVLAAAAAEALRKIGD